MIRYSRLVLTATLFALLFCTALWAAKPKTDKAPVRSTTVQKSDETPRATTSGKGDATINRTSTGIRPIETKPTHQSVINQSLQPSPLENSSSGITTNLRIDWLSVNGGGETEVSAGNYRMGVSVAQTVAAEVSSASYKMGLGFWYGAGGAGGGCSCPFVGDPDASGFYDAIDVQWAIDVVFFALPAIHDPDCPSMRVDVDCSGFPDAVDIQWMIDVVFFAGIPPCDPCSVKRYTSR